MGQAQGLASEVAGFIDRVRRSYFAHSGIEPTTSGGGLAGQPNVRPLS